MKKYMDKKVHAHELAYAPQPNLQGNHVTALSGLEATKTIGTMSWGSSPKCGQ